mmetsp:Transcript_13381/g.27500  ORF Transcript_13381/g.27500 Transcript_13381/m.27500 type:complete len:210 (+) Transcript_13381:1347-1976(+)
MDCDRSLILGVEYTKGNFCFCFFSFLPRFSFSFSGVSFSVEEANAILSGTLSSSSRSLVGLFVAVDADESRVSSVGLDGILVSLGIFVEAFITMLEYDLVSPSSSSSLSLSTSFAIRERRTTRLGEGVLDTNLITLSSSSSSLLTIGVLLWLLLLILLLLLLPSGKRAMPASCSNSRWRSCSQYKMERKERSGRWYCCVYCCCCCCCCG